MKARPGTRKGESTRQKIILTAIRLTAKHGFAEASFQMIADEIGLSQSAVMYHFPDKNALFAELVKTIVRHNHEAVSELIALKDDAAQALPGERDLGPVLPAPGRAGPYPPLLPCRPR